MVNYAGDELPQGIEIRKDGKAMTADEVVAELQAALAQQAGSGEAVGEITSVEGSIMFEPGRYRQDAVFKELYPVGTKLYTHPSASDSKPIH